MLVTKVICKCKSQISMSHFFFFFLKKAVKGSVCFTNKACFKCKKLKLECKKSLFSLAVFRENSRYCYSLGIVVVIVVQKLFSMDKTKIKYSYVGTWWHRKMYWW